MQRWTELRAAINTEPLASHSGSKKLASVAAIVVLYHPRPELLTRLIRSIASQVDKIFVIDNTPSGAAEMNAPLDACGCPFSYHANGTNKGLASAQNIGIVQALQEDFTHVLLFDQDSALPPGAVDDLLAAEASLVGAGQQVAAVGPQFVDEKTGERARSVGHRFLRLCWFTIAPHETQPAEVDYLIASGSLIRASVLRRVGLMRGELFIDWVDAEWAYRARSSGYRTFIVPTVVMQHSVGDATAKFLGKRFNLHTPARNYYIIRNAVYLLGDPHMSLGWRLTTLRYIPKYILVHSCLSNNVWLSVRQLLRAVWEGLTGTMRPFTSQ